MFGNALRRNGVKAINEQNVKFDPKLHEALSEIENPKLTPGTVAQIMQSGYLIGEKILRPAKVVVVKEEKKD